MVSQLRCDIWFVFSRIPCHCLLSSCMPGSFPVFTVKGTVCRLLLFLLLELTSFRPVPVTRMVGSQVGMECLDFSLHVSGLYVT